eukprot:CAMPEP_0119140204 /NCGR_PEP_ID=MMETSP1310-20130426/28812_1 /TAXON_ID=464262 /ORGANISM="Genus nov. species nov., Strain RCC2339" /LENGTH=255 /DNA_ID=CAMNT_0007131545 /DNA_START=26 /DNA_END=790 /DNA_ORIENTATION=-
MSSNKKFTSARCKIQLSLALKRIKIHRSRKAEQIKLHKREIADLLKTEKYSLARVKTSAVILEDCMIEAYNLVESHCEMILPRISSLDYAKSCPEEMRLAIGSVLYAAPYMNVEELLKVRQMFVAKFGKRFPEECIESKAMDEKLVRRLTQTNPPDEVVDLYIATIAEKHGVRLPDRNGTTALREAPAKTTAVSAGPSLPSVPSTHPGSADPAMRDEDIIRSYAANPNSDAGGADNLLARFSALTAGAQVLNAAS